MRFLLVFSLAILLIVGCSLKQTDSRSRVFQQRNSSNSPENFQNRERSKEDALRRARQNSSRSGDPGARASFYSGSRFLLPTITNSNDKSLMVLVNPGEYLVGMLDSEHGTIAPEEPNTAVNSLRPFYIDRLEITVAQYKKFNSQYDEKPFTDGKECPTCPAMGINWLQAYRYCQWAGKRLPTESEWMTAASGSSNYSWPWGDQFSAERANLTGEKDGALSAAPVGSYPRGVSPYGAMDMAGNVWEWVSTPYSFDRKEWQTKPLRIVKGGGWTSDPRAAKISFRNVVESDLENPTFGFRCAKSIKAKNPSRGTIETLRK